jgi:predicted ribosomally synthesized peptide with SipW-like signal peptide
MSTTETVDSARETGTRDAKRTRSLRIRALLAGGLVLGLGGTAVLAAWNDSEFAQGTFTAGTFNMQGSTDNTAWSDHATQGTAAALSFTVNPASLSPGDVVYAPFAVRLAAGTTNGATVTVSNATTTGSVANLTYTLVQPTAFGCAAATTGTALVPAATAVGTVPGSTTFPLAVGAAGAAGAQVNLCFKVTAGSGLVQGQTGTATWQFQAVSLP